jgi:hypothetical protein
MTTKDLQEQSKVAAPPAAAAAAPSKAAGTDPPSFLQWLHQTYNNQWKGAVTISTEAAPDHGPGNSHWVSSITAAGAVVKKDGKNHTLQVRGATAGEG